MSIDLQQYLDKIEDVDLVRENELIRRDFELIKSRVNDTAYKLAVVGEFSSGKSTFINSLIGKDILKHAKSETTAAITYIHNVKEGDKRENTARVNYRDERSISLKSLDEIQKYTTVQSEMNVAEEIMSVDIYVRFLNTKEDIVIVDTPGLNGIADRHREITINEIQKAHACVYLVQLRGITNTDTEFLKILLKYQRTFIFVHNFIDQLLISEGESVSGKLKEDEETVQSCFQGESYKAYFCGMSALKALVGRDRNIPRLYDNSEEDIKPEEREKLLTASGYFDFIGILDQIVHDRQFEVRRYKDNCGAIVRFIDEIMELLLCRQENMERMRGEDKKSQDMDSLKKVRDNITDSRDRVIKLLDNFVTSSFVEQKKKLYEHSREKINEIYYQMVQEINSSSDGGDIKSRYNDFMGKVGACVFENSLNRRIVDFNKVFKEEKRICANYIYKLVLARMEDYSAATGDPRMLAFAAGDFESQTFNASGEDRELAQMKRSRAADVREAERIGEIEAGKAREEAGIEDKLRQQRRLLEQKKQDYKAELDKMRRKKPEIEEWTEEVDRPGFFGFLKDYWSGKRKVKRSDDTRLRQWEAEKQAMEKKSYAETEAMNRVLENLKKKKDDLEQERDRLNADKINLERKIKICSDSIKEKEEYIKLKEENMLRTHFERMKRQLLEEIRKYLLEDEDSLTFIVGENIEKDMGKNAELIKNVVREEYDVRMKRRIEEIERSIDRGEIELNQTYTDYSKTVEQLSKIKTILEEEIAS